MKDANIESFKKQLSYYKHLGYKTFEQLEEKQLFWQFNSESNSIAVIVKHLHGNMLSRWTDFLSSDGEKDWRNRDAEFESTFTSKDEMLRKWEEGWDCLFKALDTVSESKINQKVYIRNVRHTIEEAFQRQLTHCAYHIGQIVYVARMLKAEKWESLSIPKGNSKKYNQEKFSKAKSEEHFTDEFLGKDGLA
ncbi:MAG: hypothetical protein ACI9DJ_002214 [Algoriphagus sp.]|jgi:hypothetical protein